MPLPFEEPLSPNGLPERPSRSRRCRRTTTADDRGQGHECSYDHGTSGWRIDCFESSNLSRSAIDVTAARPEVCDAHRRQRVRRQAWLRSPACSRAGWLARRVTGRSSSFEMASKRSPSSRASIQVARREFVDDPLSVATIPSAKRAASVNGRSSLMSVTGLYTREPLPTSAPCTRRQFDAPTSQP